MPNELEHEKELILKFINSIYHFNNPSGTHAAVVAVLNELTAEKYRPDTTSNAKTDK